MLGVEAVAERMADHVVGHHPTMPGAGKTAQAVVATRRLENSLHASIMTIVPCLCKTMAAASSAGGNAIRAIRQDPPKYGSRLVAKCSAIWYEIFRLVDDGPIVNKNIATELPTIRGVEPQGQFTRRYEKRDSPVAISSVSLRPRP